jgi:hypothetical protein
MSNPLATMIMIGKEGNSTVFGSTQSLVVQRYALGKCVECVKLTR